MPYVGDAMDAAVLADANASGFEKTLAGGSLTISAATGGLAPNIGGLLKGMRRIGDALGGAADVAPDAKRMNDVIDGVQGARNGADAAQNGGKAGGLSAEGPYSNLPDPQNMGPGKPFTSATKRKILDQNRDANGGTIRSDESSVEAVPSGKSEKGVTPPANEAQVDHIVPKSKGGTNSPSNAQVLTREENRAKSNR